jgi:hypothetical protein
MPKGTPLAPAVVARGVAVFSETTNYAAAARAMSALAGEEIDESVARRAILRVGEPERAELHALVAAQAERDSLDALVRSLARFDRLLSGADEVLRDAEGIPDDNTTKVLGALSRELRTTHTAIVNTNNALDRRATNAAMREKFLAEAEMMRKKAGGELSLEELLAKVTTEELIATLAAVRAKKAAGG